MNMMSTSETTESFPEKAKNTGLTGRPVLPLVVGAALFILASAAWRESAARHGDCFLIRYADESGVWLPECLAARDYVGSPLDLAAAVTLGGMAAVALLMASRLIRRPTAPMTAGGRARYIIMEVVPGVLVSLIAVAIAATTFSAPATRAVGVLAWSGIALAAASGRGQQRPAIYGVFVRLFALILLALAVHLAMTVLNYEVMYLFERITWTTPGPL